MKKQAAELGRIRTGHSRENPKGGRRLPVKSPTFIFSSHSREYVTAAAGLWGGEVEAWTPQGTKIEQYRVISKSKEIRAILPQGDPLSQSNELWSGGGCARRCDGVTESLTRQPCVCLAEHGEDWHEQPAGSVCKVTSRVNVMLPDLPDLGVWRLETHSWYAADVLAGGIDTVLAATEGKSLMPVRMWIEPREVMRKGKPKHFLVVMVVPSIPKLRQALSGPLSMAAALDPALIVDRPAIEAPRPDYYAEARMCRTPDAVIAVWRRADQAGHGSPKMLADLKKIAADIEKGIDTTTGETPDHGDGDPDDEGIVDGEIVHDDDDQDDEPPTAHPAAHWPEAAKPGGGAR
ncbi:recombination directionality factor [Streptomyces chryseus]|uniref:recombination directionality factor n=1 Tax=Streptomyces chryseus TaxID=68186 RepID=UPI00110FBB80|nr:hypothetical protein [Streptomyces chryseus]